MNFMSCEYVHTHKHTYTCTYLHECITNQTHSSISNTPTTIACSRNVDSTATGNLRETTIRGNVNKRTFQLATQSDSETGG